MKTSVHQFLSLCLIACALCLHAPQVQAQLQFIPEPFMRTWLNDLAPGCVDGAGYLDPDHPALDSVTTATLWPDGLDLTGLQYLHHLRDLSIFCPGAGIITPILPDSLERLTVGGFGFTAPLQLQAPLRYFSSWTTWSWSGTLIGPLPGTLDTLIYANFNGDGVIDLMPLPEGLVTLALRAHRLNGLTAIPSTVRTFRLHTDSAICLPTLPPVLDGFEVNSTAVNCLPSIPNVIDPAPPYHPSEHPAV